MGWPKKNEGCRVYLERKAKSYLLVFVENRTPSGEYEAIGEILIDNDPARPCVGDTMVSPSHLCSKCQRVAWTDLPEIWKNCLSEWIYGLPKDHRGLHKV